MRRMREKDAQPDDGGYGGGREKEGQTFQTRFVRVPETSDVRPDQLPFGVLFRPNGISFGSRQCDDRPSLLRV